VNNDRSILWIAPRAAPTVDSLVAADRLSVVRYRQDMALIIGIASKEYAPLTHGALLDWERSYVAYITARAVGITD